MKIGVVVGRFQVSELHAGHFALLTKAHQENDRLLVFLGVSRSPPSTREPEDFLTRQIMIQDAFPSATVVHLPDQEDDEVWSKNIDSTTHHLFPDLEKATVYGGRDSCLPHYLGVFEKVEVPNIDLASGTEQRTTDARIYGASPEFRHGVVHTVARIGKRAIMATDIALIRSYKEEIVVLLGQKPGEKNWRFPGGKLDLHDQSLEGCARRELKEETGVFAEHMEYIASFQVDDWRFTKNPDVKIFTALFLAEEMVEQEAKAADDLANLRWWDINKLLEVIRPGHRPLAEALLKHLEVRNASI